VDITVAFRSSSGLTRGPPVGPPGAAARRAPPGRQHRNRGTKSGTFDPAPRPSLNIGVHSNSPWNRHGSVVGARASGPVFMLRLMRLHLAGTWAGMPAIEAGKYELRLARARGVQPEPQDVDNPIVELLCYVVRSVSRI
jgi:hypothetical protein